MSILKQDANTNYKLRSLEFVTTKKAKRVDNTMTTKSPLFLFLRRLKQISPRTESICTDCPLNMKFRAFENLKSLWKKKKKEILTLFKN